MSPVKQIRKSKEKVQDVISSQIQLTSIYHNVISNQAKLSFMWALIATGIGLTFFFTAIYFVFAQKSQAIIQICVIAGALILFIAGISFYQSAKLSTSLKFYQEKIDDAQRILLARSLFKEDPSLAYLAVGKPLERLSNTDPKDVQGNVASQLELMAVYHNVVLDQAKQSFRWALVATGIGLIFFLAAVGFLLLQQSQGIVAATINVVSGSVIQVIAGINFFLYGKTSLQMAEFQSRLDTTQRFLLANSVCESLEGDYKQQVRGDLVRKIAGITSEKEETK